MYFNHFNKKPTLSEIKCWLFIIPILLLFSCSSHIPIVKNTDNYHQSPFGGFIELNIKRNKANLTFKGELIAVNENRIMIRTMTEGRPVISYAKKDIVSYKIYYAKNEKEEYNIWVVFNSLLTLSHGWWLILTLPLNAAIFETVNTNKKSEFRFNNKELSYDQLYLFARFPQGLPSFIKTESWAELND
ncbi:MAG: hypothetical protein H7X99_10585 [Saprospiraceae bacterium]|nr:hypothetical protein [Saprospiraceae bacterium]